MVKKHILHLIVTTRQPFYEYYPNDIIKNSSNKFLCYSNNVFLRWFHFQKVIEALVAKEIYHMELKQLLTITKQYCRIDDEVELKTMLDFYHDLGVIVKHGQTVVLQALWLIDLFKQLITVRPFDEMVSNDAPHNSDSNSNSIVIVIMMMIITMIIIIIIIIIIK